MSESKDDGVFRERAADTTQGKRLIVVSHPALHRPDALRASETLVLPASLPALTSLEHSAVALVKTSDFLISEDYQQAWDIALTTVWDQLRRALGEEDNGPNLAVIHAYSAFVLFAQIIVLDRFFDRCYERFRFTEIWIESPLGFDDDNSSLFFPPIVHPSYYHSVAAAWATSRGIRLRESERPPLAPVDAPTLPKDASRLSRAARFQRALPRVLGEVRGLMSTAATLSRVALGLREVVAYLPYRATGLYPSAPSFALNLTSLLTALRYQARLGSTPTPAGHVERFAESVSEVTGPLEPYRSLIRQRATSYLHVTYAEGAMTFHSLTRWLQRLQQRGVTLGYVGSSPFIDFGSGYIAEAFRQQRLCVAGIQHGGNARLYDRGATPILLSDFLGGLFFQWGPASTDEHVTSGIAYPCRFVTTGSPRTLELRSRSRGRNGTRDARTRPRILYAPTLLSVSTSLGNNFVWFEYIDVLRTICGLLDASGHECFVKVLGVPESNAFDWTAYRNVTVLRDGGYVDYMWDADYLVVDGLGASPLYESLATDKPILLYAGGPPQQWDVTFMAALRRRAIVFDSSIDYVDGMRRFVANPAAYTAVSGTIITDELMDTYMPPVSGRQLWDDIRSSMFPAPNAGR